MYSLQSTRCMPPIISYPDSLPLQGRKLKRQHKRKLWIWNGYGGVIFYAGVDKVQHILNGDLKGIQWGGEFHHDIMLSVIFSLCVQSFSLVPHLGHLGPQLIGKNANI